MPRSPLRDPNEEDSDDEDPQERLQTRSDGYDRSRSDRDYGHYDATRAAYEMQKRCGCTDGDISPLGCKMIIVGVFSLVVCFSLSLGALLSHGTQKAADLDQQVSDLQAQVTKLQDRLDAAHQTDCPDSLYKVFATLAEKESQTGDEKLVDADARIEKNVTFAVACVPAIPGVMGKHGLPGNPVCPKKSGQ